MQNKTKKEKKALIKLLPSSNLCFKKLSHSAHKLCTNIHILQFHGFL